MTTTTCGYCRDLFRPKRSTAVYCSDTCRKAASRQRQAKERPRDVRESLVTLTEPIPRVSKPPSWRWYERLDGSCDLYRDTETTMRHVARIVRRNGGYRLDKPSGLTSEVWGDCRAAWDAVRSLIG